MKRKIFWREELKLSEETDRKRSERKRDHEKGD